MSQRLSVLLFLFLASPIALFSQDVEEQTQGIRPSNPVPEATDKVSAKIIHLHLKARGGVERMKHFRSLRYTGTYVEGQNDFQITWLMKPPAKFRIELSRNHMGWDHHSLVAFDGTEGWTQEIQPEKRNPEELGKKVLNLHLFKSEFLGVFYQYEKKGHVFIYKGEAYLGGKKAYVLKGYLKYGLEVEILFDPKTFHIINYRIPDVFAGKTIQIDRLPTGLKRVNGVLMETGYDYRAEGKSYKKVEFDQIEPNVDFPSSEFNKPAKREIWLRGR